MAPPRTWTARAAAVAAVATAVAAAAAAVAAGGGGTAPPPHAAPAAAAAAVRALDPEAAAALWQRLAVDHAACDAGRTPALCKKCLQTAKEWWEKVGNGLQGTPQYERFIIMERECVYWLWNPKTV